MIRAGRAAAALLVTLVATGLATGCGNTAAVPSAGAPAAGHRSGGLAALLARSQLIGATDSRQLIAVNLGLTGRDPQGLAELIAAGGRVTPSEYATRFGPDPSRVQPIVDGLTARGAAAHWSGGSPILAVDAPAGTVASLFGVAFDDYLSPDGLHFYAADRDPSLPGWMSPEVTSVDGLDDADRVHHQALRPGSTGVSPSDVLSFYNLKALRDAGLDGRGETVMLPDVSPLDSDLAAYAQQYGLPPFEYQVKGGTIETANHGEVSLDMEIIHGLAPAAKMVIYTDPTPKETEGDLITSLVRENDTMVKDDTGNVISESLGWCEADWDQGSAQQIDAIFSRAMVEGITTIVSSGDEGAYGCVRVDKNQSRVSVALPASDPLATSVGGTTVFLTADGSYGREAVWGNPVSWGGGGGGLSAIFPRPSWQTGPGVDVSKSNRGVPDVAALGDSNSGWSIISDGKTGTYGGTSAATPLWAAFVAMLNQDLRAKGLHPAGFANPALYDIGRRNTDLPGPPFHDVVLGNNLLYAAGPGWDYATGWGSMNGGALASAWEAYIKAGGA